MECPFDGETALSDIIDANPLHTDLSAKISRFKTILTPDQKVEFNAIDDLFTQIITQTQHATLKVIHCPTCVNVCGCT
jgi:hypothetical protein